MQRACSKPITKYVLLRLARIHGPAFTTDEAADELDVGLEYTDDALCALWRKGLLAGKEPECDKIWWLTNDARELLADGNGI